MRRKLIIDGNAVYEIDSECMRCKEERETASMRQKEDRSGMKYTEVSEKVSLPGHPKMPDES